MSGLVWSLAQKRGVDYRDGVAVGKGGDPHWRTALGPMVYLIHYCMEYLGGGKLIIANIYYF